MRFWIILADIIAPAAPLAPLSLRQEPGWIDAISGAQKHQVVW